MLSITELTCEYRKNPVGLDNRNPRISWKLWSDCQNTMQTGYRVQVSQCEDFALILWDTGEVNTDQSIHVQYKGPCLIPRTRYYYRVMVTDNHGEYTGWSEPAFWETGMMNPSEWAAGWITAGMEEDLSLNAVPLLRKTFPVGKEIETARVYATALGLYTLYINGARVGEDYFTPGWTSYASRIQYQTYDVTHLLQTGKNAIGAMLGNGWYAGYIAGSGERGFYGKQRALLLQLHLHFTDGSEQVILTDGSWKSAVGPVQVSEFYHGETYDARRERTNWHCAECDLTGWEPVRRLEHSLNMLTAQESELPQIMEEIKPVALIRTPAGENVLDFGQNMVGFVRFSVQGSAGDRVILRHAEVLDRDGNFYTGNLRGARQRIEYILRGGEEETYQPHFTFQGFRYVCVDRYPGEIDPERFTGCVVHSALQTAGSFVCSDKLVNQLQHNILWGQKGNFVDVPTDCPQRDERHGWTGDAQMFIRTACFNMNSALFFRKWLRDLACEQTDSYGVTNVVPNIRETSYAGAAAWGDAATICPWTLYLYYGDRQVLEEQYISMKRWVEYIKRQGDDPYLWNTGEHFGDWVALDNGPGAWIGRTPVDLIATAFYAHSTRLLADAAEVLEYQEDAEEYQTLFKKIKCRFLQEFVTADGELVEDTQTAYILVLMFDLLEEKDRKRAADKLAELLHQNRDHLNTGFVGTPYLCHVLSRFGHHDLAGRLLLHTDYPSWLYSITKGATTIWEHWDGIREDGSFWDDLMNSFNHYSYGSIGDWMYRVVAGLDIDPAAPGYKHFYICPKPVKGLTYAKAVYQSPYGRIICGWRQNGSVMEITVEIPPNTTATLTLPDADLEDLSKCGFNTVSTTGGAQRMLGSGEYTITYPMRHGRS